MAYDKAFDVAITAGNISHIQRLICKARAVACREATARLSWSEDRSEAWIDEALGDDARFTFELAESATATDVIPPIPPALTSDRDPGPAPPVHPKKAQIEASEEAIARHHKAGDWDTGTVKQVRTATRISRS
jgi:hypothetical protein